MQLRTFGFVFIHSLFLKIPFNVGLNRSIWVKSGFSFTLFFLIVLLPTSLLAQNNSSQNALNTAPKRKIQADSTGKNNPAVTPPLPKEPEENPPNTSVTFTAKDSLFIQLKGGRKANLFGASQVTHESGNLKAGKITVDFESNVMSAEAANSTDTLSHPILSRGSDELRSRKILFNYKIEQGKFYVARMNYNEGNLIGTEVKNKTEHVVFVGDGIYSTCLLDHPHYFIKAKKMKVVDEEEIFFTNAKLYLLDIPYPFILPFGYVPAKMSQKQSGLIAPSYAFQNVNNRGIGLQNLGWFQYINDYFTTKITGSFFTSGSFNTESDLNYAIRDRLSGSIRLGYSRTQGMEPTDPNFSSSTTSLLSIRHNQTINPYSQLNANITLRSAEHNRNVSYNIEEQAEVSTSSNMSYQFNEPEGLFNFSVGLNQSQNFATNTFSMQAPVTLGFKQFTPFQKTNQANSQAAGPLQTLSISFRSQMNGNFQFSPIDRDSSTINWFQALFSPSQYREATGRKIPIQWGAFHSIGVTSRLIPSEFVNVLANINVQEYWHPYTIEEFYDTTANRTDFNVQNGFASARDFAVSLNMNTKLYGIANPQIGSLKSLRHTVMPSLTMSYTPDFTTPFWGFYRTYNRTNADGTVTKVTYSPFQQGVYGTSLNSRTSAALSFSLNNVLEAKTVSRDTLGEKKERIIKLIDTWNISTSYNFVAKNFKLAPLGMSLSSSIINNINLRANASFTFYDRDSAGTLIDEYLWTTQRKPFRMTSFRFDTGTRFASGRMTKPVAEPVYFPETYDPLNQQDFMPVNPLYYITETIDYTVPWSVSLNFSYSWNNNGRTVTKQAVINASSIQINPTPKWNVTTQIGYDFTKKKLTPNQIRVSRNLHCWDMSFMWNPFSPTGQSYYLFRLSVNNQQFQSLFQKLPVLNNLERNSSGRITRPMGF